MREELMVVASKLVILAILALLITVGGPKMASKFLLWVLNLPLRIFTFGFWTIPSRMLSGKKQKKKKRKR